VRGRGRRGQDQPGRSAGARPGARRGQGAGVHHRPGQAPGQRPGAHRPGQRRVPRPRRPPGPGRPGAARPALRHDARREADLGRPDRAPRPRPGPPRPHPPQPALPADVRGPGRLAGVHGHGEAARAGRGPRLRPDRARHPSHRPRPRLPRRPHPHPRLPGQRRRPRAARAGGGRRAPGASAGAALRRLRRPGAGALHRPAGPLRPGRVPAELPGHVRRVQGAGGRGARAPGPARGWIRARHLVEPGRRRRDPGLPRPPEGRGHAPGRPGGEPAHPRSVALPLPAAGGRRAPPAARAGGDLRRAPRGPPWPSASPPPWPSTRPWCGPSGAPSPPSSRRSGSHVRWFPASRARCTTSRASPRWPPLCRMAGG